MCFSPQRRAIFEHPNLKKCSDTVSFLAFSLPNVLFATAACHFWTSKLQKVLRHRQFFSIFTSKCAFRHSHFWTSKLQKVLRHRQFFSIFTSKCAFRHSGVPFFTCLLNSYVRTRRFSEPTFRTSGTTNHSENTAIRDVPNIFRACTFFPRTLHACGSSFCGLDISTLLDTSTLLFNSAYCRKLDF